MEVSAEVKAKALMSGLGGGSASRKSEMLPEYPELSDAVAVLHVTGTMVIPALVEDEEVSCNCKARTRVLHDCFKKQTENQQINA